MKKHIIQVDYIRAIAASAVTLFHLGGKALPVLRYGWLGVYLFFFLSGFIICWSMTKGYTYAASFMFITKRLMRIEPPYLISVALALAANFILVPYYIPDLRNILFHFAYLNSFFNQPYLSPVYWTLAVEFQFYIFIALLFPLILKKWGVAVVVVLALFSMKLPSFQIQIIQFFPIFGMGIIYYLHYSKQLNTSLSVIFITITAICSVHNCGSLETGAALFALVLLVLPLKQNPVISFLSAISFSLYLTHDIIGSNLVAYLGALLPKTFLYRALEFATGIVVSVAFAYLFYRIVERPFILRAKRMSKLS
jgi:peptidoglycan/LPS O-acetylase OafA/YrhL